jgi:hypothetical protein
VTYALLHVEINKEEIPCVVRQEDGGFLTLNDTNTLIELRLEDRESYELVMALARKMLTSGGPHLIA